MIVFTQDILKAIAKTAHAKEAFIYRNNVTDQRKLIVTFDARGLRRKSVVIPERKNPYEMQEWLWDVVQDMTPKKPRKGAAIRGKILTSIKSKLEKPALEDLITELLMWSANIQGDIDAILSAMADRHEGRSIGV